MFFLFLLIVFLQDAVLLEDTGLHIDVKVSHAFSTDVSLIHHYFKSRFNSRNPDKLKKTKLGPNYLQIKFGVIRFSCHFWHGSHLAKFGVNLVTLVLKSVIGAHCLLRP